MLIELATRSTSPRKILSGGAGDGFATITGSHENMEITERHMKVLIALEESSRLGTRPSIRVGDAEECVDLELVEASPTGYSLTKAGITLLREKSDI